MKKFFIIIIFLILTINVSFAVNPNDFTLPDGFVLMEYEFEHNHSEGFMNEKGECIIIYDYTSDDKDYFFTDYDNYVCDIYENNIYTFADADTELCGYVECIEYDGKEYVIQTTGSIDKIDEYGYDIIDNMLKFNKLNHFEPIPV